MDSRRGKHTGGPTLTKTGLKSQKPLGVMQFCSATYWNLQPECALGYLRHPSYRYPLEMVPSLEGTGQSINNYGESVPVTPCHGWSLEVQQMTSFLVVNLHGVTVSHGQSRFRHALKFPDPYHPRCSMWHIYLPNWVVLGVNIVKHAIHWASGILFKRF